MSTLAGFIMGVAVTIIVYFIVKQIKEQKK